MKQLWAVLVAILVLAPVVVMPASAPKIQKVDLATKLSCEDQPGKICMIGGGKPRVVVLMDAVTGNTTTAAVDTIMNSNKIVYVLMTGTGSISGVLTIFGGPDNTVTTTTGIPLCTIRLTGTTTVPGYCPKITEPWLWWIGTITLASGTISNIKVSIMMQ